MNPSKAWRFGLIGISITSCFNFITLIPFYTFREEFADFFTTDPQVKEALLKSFMIWFAAIVVDQQQAVITGIIRGIGKQNYAAATFIIC